MLNDVETSCPKCKFGGSKPFSTRMSCCEKTVTENLL